MLFDCKQNFVSTTIKRIFARTKREEKLKVVCKYIVRTLGNEYEELTNNNALVRKNSSLNSYDKWKENFDNLRKLNDEAYTENCQESIYVYNVKYNVKNDSINFYLNDLKENFQKQKKDISGYLIQKAILNARSKSVVNNNKMRDNVDDINNDNLVMSNINNQVNDNLSINSKKDNGSLVSPSLNSVRSFNEDLFLQNALGSMANIEETESVFKPETTQFNNSLQESVFFKLKEEVDYQSQIIMEISKLLDTFKTKIEFYGSPEHLEAEKLMLLGCYRHDHLIKRIRENYYECIDKNSAIVGSIKVSDFQIPLLESPSSNYNEWFLCIVSCGEEIFISEPVGVHYNWIRFEEIFSFHNICWDAVIDINVYSMRIPKLGTLKKFLNKKICSDCQSKKLLYKDLRTYDLIECEIRNSMFRLCSTLKMNVQELKNKNPPKLEVVDGFALENKLYMKTHFGDLHYVSKHSGFLTIGKEINKSLIWSRKWCVLDGTVFKYWNYPIDEEFKPPIGVLDLKKSKTLTVKLAERITCPKPRTFLLDFDGNNKRYYFSADSSDDLKKWKNILDEVTICLKGWNLLYNPKK